MKVSINRLINPTLSLSVIVFGITIIIWGIVFLLSDVNPSHTSESTLSLMLDNLLESNLLQNIVVFLISALNALLILQLNNRFTIIRTRTFMPVIIYLLLISVWKETHDLVSLHFTLSLIIGSFFVFFNMFRNKEATEQAFLGSFFISTHGLVSQTTANYFSHLRISANQYFRIFTSPNTNFFYEILFLIYVLIVFFCF